MRTQSPPGLNSLTDLAAAWVAIPGFRLLTDALLAGHGAALDGAWGSSAALAVPPSPRGPGRHPRRRWPIRAISRPGPPTCTPSAA